MSYTLAYTGAEIDALLGKIDAIFVAEYGSTIYSEITAAIAAGNKVIVANAGKVYVYAGQDDNGGYVFTQSGPNAAKPNATYVTLSTGDVWSTATVDLATLQQFYDTFMTDTASGSIASFPDGANGAPIKEMTVQITPQQDLHGYSNPWPAGGGKNKCAPEVGTDTQADVTAVVADNGITTTSGTASATAAILVGRVNVENGVSYILSGCPASGSDTTYRLDIRSNGTTVVASDKGSGVTFTATATAEWLVAVRIYGGASAAGLTFKPMVCLSTATDPTVFAPYSNICLISGHAGANVYVTGINVWDEETELGGINASTGANNSLNDRLRSSYIPVKPSTSYFINTSQWSGAYCYDKDKTFIGAATYVSSGTGWVLTTLAGSAFVRVAFAAAYGTTYNNDISINYPSTDTSYHAYNGTTYSIDWTDEAGTVYGGYFVVNEDGSVDLTKDYKYIFADGDAVKVQIVQQGGTGNYYCQIAVGDTTPYSADKKTLSSMFADRGVGAYIGNCYINTSGTYLVFVPADQTITTVEAANTWLASNNVQFAYALATPQTYHLADIVELKTLLGSNNIFADCGDVEVEYRCNTALYIEKKLGE